MWEAEGNGTVPYRTPLLRYATHRRDSGARAWCVGWVVVHEHVVPEEPCVHLNDGCMFLVN